MNIELKDFQVDASKQLLTELRLAKSEISLAAKTEAVILSAPTGSGKTMIATDVIERVFEGYDTYEPESDAVFLWLTDQPELNEQTRKKMLGTSTVLGPSRLITIDSAFDQETFTGGNVYFLNTQKLGKDKSLVETGDERAFTIWQTISNTVRRDSGKFYLIVDEAHRGMAVSDREQADARTIVQKFIKGSPGEIPAIPLVIGISATPDRFRTVLEGTQRVQRPIHVDSADVRASGLIKDYVRFRTPKDAVPSDITLLRGAVERWKSYESLWQAYCESEGIAVVKPLLIIQVEDAGPNHPISKTSLDEVVAAIEDIVGHLPADRYAHAFMEGTTITVGGSRTIRYLAPSEITDDPSVQVVFFKTSLSTGWDCPRAEVMMSFRRANDATLIAQLVGRMVRTPLARRIDKNEMLNSVTLLLPHYDAAELQSVVARLKAADPDGMPPTEVEDDDDVQDLTRAAGSEACFIAATQIPTYVMPGRAQISELRRLMRMSRFLVNSDLDSDAIHSAQSLVFDTVDAEYESVKSDPVFKENVTKAAGIDIEERTLEVGGDLADIPQSLWLESSQQNLDDRFGTVGRQLGEGLHKTYWRHRTKKIGDPNLAKCETIAMLAREGLTNKITTAASKLFSQWREKHRIAIQALPEEQRQVYREILGGTKEPQRDDLDLPQSIEVTRKPDATLWEKHVYADEKGRFETKLGTSWETIVMQDELGRLDTVGWLRNLPRKRYALCVPYTAADGKKAGLYPDFLIFRQTPHGVVPDIVDPHLVSLDDASFKAKGLAEYVDLHPNVFGRVIIARVEDGVIQRLDLADDAVRREVRTVTTNNHLRSLYNTMSS
jgi:type III restriction enzyme